jgi:hypothetical protein
MIRTVNKNPIPEKASRFMTEFLKSCDANGNVIVMGRVEGSQTKGLSSGKSDVDLTIAYLEGFHNLVSLRTSGIKIDKLPFEKMDKRDLHGEVVKEHVGFVFEGTDFELTVTPMFTKGHLVYPNSCETCPENINVWTEARSGNEIVPQLYFQNGKAIYDLFTAHEVFERPEWTKLKELASNGLHISADALFGFFFGYMNSQLRAHENTLSFKNFLNVNNLTTSKVWQYMTDEEKKDFHAAVRNVQRAFELFKKSNPIIKGKRWIDFEKREAKAIEENKIDPVVKQILEGTYIGMCGIYLFEKGAFHCNYASLLDELSGTFSPKHVELLRRCLRHKTGVERMTVPVERFIEDVREPRLEMFHMMRETLEKAHKKQTALPAKLTPQMQEENARMLQDYLIAVTPKG